MVEKGAYCWIGLYTALYTAQYVHTQYMVVNDSGNGHAMRRCEEAKTTTPDTEKSEGIHGSSGLGRPRSLLTRAGTKKGAYDTLPQYEALALIPTLDSGLFSLSLFFFWVYVHIR